jgi:gliding motility-associated lipoprotein GldH
MRTFQKTGFWILSGMLLLVFAGCGRHTLFSGTVQVHDAWAKGDAARFEVTVPDTVTAYNFYVDVRHTVKYRYSNLYLFMQTRFPRQTFTRDTLEITLATPEGKWLGKGWGKIKEDHVLVRSKFRFPVAGKYEFLIWQGMRTDTLKAVRSVGIDIEKVD